MTPTFQRDIIQKGVFAVAVVAAVAVVGVVSFAKADVVGGQGSGYGTSSQTQLAAANTFESSFNSQSSSWRSDVNGYIADLESKVQANGQGSAADFQSAFSSANSQYDSTVSAALDKFRSQVEDAMNSGENKDQFIDSFNHAKADYFNTLEQAKNTLADQLNRFGDAVAKDQFMNDYNARKGTYGNALEDAKNTFAATLG